MQGAYIVSSPNPVSQAEFAKELRRAIGMPIGLPATEWMVRIGAPLLMQTDPELAIYGRYVLPKRLLDEGFEFRFPMLADALREMVQPASDGEPSRLNAVFSAIRPLGHTFLAIFGA